jgi:hypothetical protein
VLDFLIGFLSALVLTAGASAGAGLYVKKNPRVLFRVMNNRRKKQISKATKRNAA